MKYLTRPRAAERLTAEGIEISAAALADQAHDGVGPRYVIINGRALYTEADLLAWIEEQASRPVVRRSQRKRSPQSASSAAPKTTNAETASLVSASYFHSINGNHSDEKPTSTAALDASA